MTPFLRWDSWIGADRDGNPSVTAEVTERTLRIQADHVLRGYEAVATRLSQTLAAAVVPGPRRAGARHPPRAGRRAPAGPRSDAPAAVSRGALPAAVRVHRGAAAPDAGPSHRTGRAADGSLRRRGRARRGAGGDPGGAGRRRAGSIRLGRGRRPALAGGDVRVPPRVARGPPAQRRPSRGRGGDRGQRSRRASSCRA